MSREPRVWDYSDVVSSRPITAAVREQGTPGWEMRREHETKLLRMKLFTHARLKYWYKNYNEQMCFFKFGIIINVLVSSFVSFEYLCYESTTFWNKLIISVWGPFLYVIIWHLDVRLWCIKTVINDNYQCIFQKNKTSIFLFVYNSSAVAAYLTANCSWYYWQ